MRIVVNTISTKSHSGGALQIAYNFLLETLMHQDDAEWFYITSADVDSLFDKEFDDLLGSRYFVFPTQPDFKGTYHHVKRQLAEWEKKYRPDVIYTISSPCYFNFKTTEVMRFANAWITNPNSMAWKSMSLKARVRMLMYRLNQNRMLRKARYIITQSETVKHGLIRITGLPEKNVKVVPNVLPKVFLDAPVNHISECGIINIASVAAPVPHKNLDIIPKVARILRQQHGIANIRFHLTIPEDDTFYRLIYTECEKYKLTECIVNHGRCSQLQLCEIYNYCDICFLPTLLETFSASSLEAMHFGIPIVATDFEFNKEVIGDAGLYFKPMCPEEAADRIALIIKDEKVKKNLQEKMKRRILLYNNYSKHFSQIVDFLKNTNNN